MITFAVWNIVEYHKEEIMKNLTIIAFCWALCLSFTSCGSDDHAPNISFVTPNTSGHQLRTVTHAGYLPDTYDWVMTYNGKNLTGGTGSYLHETTSDYSYQVSLGFTSSTVNITSSAAEKSTITIGANRLISQMKVNDNTFEFAYNSNGYMTEWKENVVNTGFGSVTSYNAKATLSYTTSNDLKQIVYTNNDDYPDNLCTLTFTPADTLNINGLLPEAISKQMGVLGFEYLYYAGALGKASSRLIRSIHVAYNATPAADYDLVFHYVLNKDNDVVFCSYTYKGQSASATYKY